MEPNIEVQAPSRLLPLLAEPIRIEAEGVYVKDGPGLCLLPWAELIMINSEDHQSCFVSSSRRSTIRVSLVSIEDKLEAYGLVRINRKTILNLRFVKRFTSGPGAKVILTQGESLPVTRRRRTAVIQKYHTFLFQKQKVEVQYPPMAPIHVPAKDLAGEQLWTDPSSKVRKYIGTHPDLDPQRLAAFEYLARTPSATWLGDWNKQIFQDVRPLLVAADQMNQIPVLVVYRLFLREETRQNRPNLQQLFDYKTWVSNLSAALGQYKAILILEPNALSMIDDDLPRDVQELYLDALRFAVGTLRKNSRARLYLDAGHPGWRSPEEMAVLLARAGIDFAHGFAVNVSHFMDLDRSHEYGLTISRLLGGKSFVVDTGRNGQGITHPEQWCNPSGVGTGRLPMLAPRLEGVDALLWIKPPGESDTEDGNWRPEQAWDLVQRSNEEA